VISTDCCCWAREAEARNTSPIMRDVLILKDCKNILR
jgi:hypothetical protein